MTAKEFLSMQYGLNLHIESDIRELSHLREMSMQLSAPSTGDKVSCSRHNDAPFARLIDKIIDLERDIDSQIDTYVDLRKDIRSAIDAVDDPRLRSILQYRYLQNLSWQEIAQKLYADRTSVYRWHKQALGQIKVPEKYANS